MKDVSVQELRRALRESKGWNLAMVHFQVAFFAVLNLWDDFGPEGLMVYAVVRARQSFVNVISFPQKYNELNSI